jgi:hypothetical protein
MRDYNRDLADATHGKLSEKGDDELDDMLRWWITRLTGNPTDHMAMLVLQEVRREMNLRQIRTNQKHLMDAHGRLETAIIKPRKPHWTLTPGFIVGFFAMLFAAIAAWPVIREWFRSDGPSKRTPNFQLQQSNSAPALLPVLQTSPPPVSVNPEKK